MSKLDSVDLLIQSFNFLGIINHHAHEFVDLQIQLLVLFLLGFLHLFKEVCTRLFVV